VFDASRFKELTPRKSMGEATRVARPHHGTKREYQRQCECRHVEPQSSHGGDLRWAAASP